MFLVKIVRIVRRRGLADSGSGMRRAERQRAPVPRGLSSASGFCCESGYLAAGGGLLAVVPRAGGVLLGSGALFGGSPTGLTPPPLLTLAVSIFPFLQV